MNGRRAGERQTLDLARLKKKKKTESMEISYTLHFNFDFTQTRNILY